MASQKLLSLIVLTYNEESNLPGCLESLSGLDCDVFVVDSGSTDGTLEIARDEGCRVFTHPFERHSSQLNWALEALPIETPWVMRLDADERLTLELAAELRQVLPTLGEDVSGLLVKRRVLFLGRWIRHGGYYPTWLLRLWRQGRARCEERWMDEHMVLEAGRAVRLTADLIDENQKGLIDWAQKHVHYATRELKDLQQQPGGDGQLGLRGQAVRRRWMKQNVYARLPLFLRAFLYWFYRYFLLLGFLDGKPGLVFHFLQALWYRFLVDAGLYEEELARRGKEKAE